ncbi:MAG: Clp protease ClpP [Rikenellaceae bacterium]
MEEIKIVNNLDSVVIDIEGTIGVAEEAQFDNPQQRVATYERFRQKLSEIEQIEAKSVVVNIRSTGGDVNDAMLIYDALAALDAVITTRCWGYVASAATIIAQAASSGLREISPNALYLIHNSTSYVEGNAEQLERRVELLHKSDERIANLYAQRSGREVEYFTQLMAESNGEGRWLTAEQTVEAALADVIIEQLHEAEETSDNPVLRTIENAVNRVRTVLGLDNTEQPTPAVSASVTHEESIAPTPQSSTIAFEQRQSEFGRTVIGSVEDPALSDQLAQTPNQIAYNNDLRSFRR